MFVHLVSDQSLAKLHEFASRLGVSVRAFDQDHYDIPAHRHADALALGARSRWKARILARSLIPQRPAGPRTTPPGQAGPGAHPPLGAARSGASRPGLAPAGALARTARAYHGPAHLLKVLEAVDLLTDGHRPRSSRWRRGSRRRAPGAGRRGKDSAALRPAAAGPRRVAPDSARRPAAAGRGGPRPAGGSGEGDAARVRVSGGPARRTGPRSCGVVAGRPCQQVAELVMVARGAPAGSADRDACVLVTRVFAVLGGTVEELRRYRADAPEYADVPESQFRAARAGAAEPAVQSPSVHHGTAVALCRETQARRNVAREIQLLTGQ
ncbi:DUF4031 domain-containing protein [Kocuria rhizophila]|nr:DUF4031 domain-containing protein [Kocuria rhizophila]